MKRNHFSTAEINAALRDLEAGVRLPEVCARFGVSEVTLSRWRRKAGLLAPKVEAVTPVSLSVEQAATRVAGLERRLEAFRQVLVTLLEPPELERASRLLEAGLSVSARRARQLLGLAPINAPAAEDAGKDPADGDQSHVDALQPLRAQFP